MKKIFRGFTLVELIVVIAILAILAITSFVVLSQWFVKSRNIRRVADLQWLKTALNSYYYSNFKYPMPGEAIEIRDENDEVIWYQWLFDESVWGQMREVTKVPQDPLDKEYYGYSILVKNGEWYELVAFLEVVDTNLLWGVDKAYAISLSSRVPYVIGEYQEKWDFHLKPLTFIHPDYGVITSLILWSGWYVKIDTNTLTWYESSGWVVWGVNVEWWEFWVADVIEIYPSGVIDPNQVSQALPVVGGVSSSTVSTQASGYMWLITWGGYDRVTSNIAYDNGFVYVVWNVRGDDNINSGFVAKLDMSTAVPTPVRVTYISGVELKKVVPYPWGWDLFVFWNTQWGYFASELSDIFVSRLDSNWNILWQKALGDAGTDIYENLFSDAARFGEGDLFILGYTTSSTANKDGRRMLVHLDLLGNHLLKRYLGSWWNFQPEYLKADNLNFRLYLAWNTTIAPFGYKDMFWWEISTTWLMLWARHFWSWGESYSLGSVEVYNNEGLLTYRSPQYINIISDNKTSFDQKLISGWTAYYSFQMTTLVSNSSYYWWGRLELASKWTCYWVVFEKDLANWIIRAKRLGGEVLLVDNMVKLSNGSIVGIGNWGVLFITQQNWGAWFDESGLYTVQVDNLTWWDMDVNQIEQSTRSDDIPPTLNTNLPYSIGSFSLETLNEVDSSTCPVILPF